MSEKLLQIGIFQLSSHPAVCLGDRDILMEPVFPFDDERSLTVLAREVFELRDCLKEVKEKYIKWHKDRLDTLLAWLLQQSSQPDILVFPECGIPFECLSALRNFSEQTGIIVFAGTHTPRFDAVSISHYKKVLKVRNKHFKDLENNPPPAILPIITPNETILHRKAAASIFERQDVRIERKKPVKTKTVNVGKPSIRVTPLVCAEALQLTSWDEDLPDLVIIVAMERNPNRFDSLIKSLVANQIPVILANDGAYGGSGAFTAVDRRSALWWFGAPNHGTLPVCDAYLQVAIDLSTKAVQVAVSNPGQPAILTRLTPILSADNQLLALEDQLLSAVEQRDPSKLKAVRLDFGDKLSHAPLTSRRLTYFERLAENGTLTNDIIQSLASHISLAPQPGLGQLEAKLVEHAVDHLSRIIHNESAERLPDEVYAPLVKVHRSLEKRVGNRTATAKVIVRSAPPIGRSQEISEVRAFVATGPPHVMVLTGLEAVGKTTVIDAALRQRGVHELVIECRSGTSADALFEVLLRSTGRIPSGSPPRARFSVTDLTDALMDLELVYFRDCHQLLEFGNWRTNAIQQFFDSLFDARQNSRCHLLFESRRGMSFNPPLGTQIERRRIGGLTPSDGLAFLDQQIRLADGSPDNAVIDDRKKIVSLASGHPGFLVLCADVFVRHGPNRVIKELEGKKGFFLSSIRRMLDAIQLSPNAEACLWLLSNCRLPIPKDVLNSGCDANGALPELLDACLVDCTLDGLYEIIRLLKETELETGSCTQQAAEAFDRAASHYFFRQSSVSDAVSSYQARVEANYHASLAGITPPCDLGGLIDSLAAAVKIEFDQQRYERVIQMLSRVPPERMPEDLLAILSKSYAWCNQFSQAFDLADRVVRVNRTYVSLFTDACNAAIRSRNWDVANEALKKAERLEPGFYQIHRFKGQIAEHERRPYDAIHHYKAAVDATERDPWPYFFLARAYVRLGQPDKALDIAEAARAFTSSYRRRQFENALLSQELLAVAMSGEEKAAEKMLDVLDRSESESPEMLVTAAYVRAFLSPDENGAIQAFTNALSKLKNEDSRKAHVRAKIAMFRGKLLQRVGSLGDAESAFSEACRLDSHNVHMKECLLRVLKVIAKEAKENRQPTAEVSAARRATEIASEILKYDSNHAEANNSLQDMHYLHRIS